MNADVSARTRAAAAADAGGCWVSVDRPLAGVCSCLATRPRRLLRPLWLDTDLVLGLDTTPVACGVVPSPSRFLLVLAVPATITTVIFQQYYHHNTEEHASCFCQPPITLDCIQLGLHNAKVATKARNHFSSETPWLIFKHTFFLQLLSISTKTWSSFDNILWIYQHLVASQMSSESTAHKSNWSPAKNHITICNGTRDCYRDWHRECK